MTAAEAGSPQQPVQPLGRLAIMRPRHKHSMHNSPRTTHPSCATGCRPSPATPPRAAPRPTCTSTCTRRAIAQEGQIINAPQTLLWGSSLYGPRPTQLQACAAAHNLPWHGVCSRAHRPLISSGAVQQSILEPRATGQAGTRLRLEMCAAMPGSLASSATPPAPGASTVQ